MQLALVARVPRLTHVHQLGLAHNLERDDPAAILLPSQVHRAAQTPAQLAEEGVIRGGPVPPRRRQHRKRLLSKQHALHPANGLVLVDHHVVPSHDWRRGRALEGIRQPRQRGSLAQRLEVRD